MEELGNLIQVVTDGRILGNQFLKFGKFGSDIVVDFYVFVQRTLPDINSNRIACLFSRNGNRSKIGRASCRERV